MRRISNENLKSQQRKEAQIQKMPLIYNNSVKLSNYHLQNNTFLSAACTAGSWEMFRLIAGQ